LYTKTQVITRRSPNTHTHAHTHTEETRHGPHSERQTKIRHTLISERQTKIRQSSDTHS